jgi:hypothetical protein
MLRGSYQHQNTADHRYGQRKAFLLWGDVLANACSCRQHLLFAGLISLQGVGFSAGLYHMLKVWIEHTPDV